MQNKIQSFQSPFLSRRRFLELTGLSGLSLLLSSCTPSPAASPAPAHTSTPLTPKTETPTTLPTATETTALSATPSYRSLVATARADQYDPVLLRPELERMFDSLGGMADLIRPGMRVGIKPNLTGETWSDASLPSPTTELFVTHPALVQALAEIMIDAGAASVTIMDGLGDPLIFDRWGYRAVAQNLGASLVDLCLPDPYADFTLFPVGKGYSIYESFQLNPILGEVDVFISVAKMKCHSTTGVTLSLKNLFGIAPTSLYRNDPTHNNRSAFHGDYAYDQRVPRVILDINLARPVHLAVIDGIITAEGGAGVWDTGFNQVRPGVLIASRDPVAADSVAAAVMGFDPAAPSGTLPFLYGDNHLALAHETGLGSNRLSEIGVAGPSIQEIQFPFRPVLRSQ